MEVEPLTRQILLAKDGSDWAMIREAIYKLSEYVRSHTRLPQFRAAADNMMWLIAELIHDKVFGPGVEGTMQNSLNHDAAMGIVVALKRYADEHPREKV